MIGEQNQQSSLRREGEGYRLQLGLADHARCRAALAELDPWDASRCLVDRAAAWTALRVEAAALAQLAARLSESGELEVAGWIESALADG